MTKLYPTISSLLDGEPVILPRFEGAPPQVPQVLLQNTAGDLRAEISPERLNVIWRQPPDPQSTIATALERWANLLDLYGPALGERVGRMALVVTHVARTNDPVECVANTFGYAEKFPDETAELRALEVHVHRKLAVRDRFESNLWIRHKTGKISKDNVETPALLCEQDVNTLSEEVDSRSFSPAEMREFFAAASDVLQGNLARYYR